MTDWDALRDSANEPDTLEKIRETLTGAILPMANAMQSPPTTLQLTLLRDELMDLVYRIEDMLYEEARNGDDANGATDK